MRSGTKRAAVLTIWVANDAPFRALHEITEALNMPKDKIRFINPAQGGGFGSKGGLKVEPIAVALAFHTNGRPVRVKFNREETFISTLDTPRSRGLLENRRKKRRHSCGARNDDLLGRRRLRRKKPDGLHPRQLAGARPVSNSACQSRRLCGLHQQAGRRFLPRLRHPAGRLGRRTADGRDRQTPRHGCPSQFA